MQGMSIENMRQFSRYALLFIKKTFQRDTRKKNAKVKYINKNKISPESSPRNPLVIIIFTSYAAHLELAYGVRMEVLVRCVLPPRGELQKQTGHLDQVFFSAPLSPPTPPSKRTFEAGPLQPHSTHLVQPTGSDLYSASPFPYLASQRLHAADAIVTPASEQIIEMHQRRRGVGVRN